ncbi:MAG: ferrous iron transport protein A [Thiomargarita sp.]|nr:ferrous iron transport protein A [Thiomargarita sp.]
MKFSLRDLKLGDKGIVKGFEKGNKIYRKKLLSMGLTPGSEFSITRYAPLGDPVEIQVRGFFLSLRQDEAATLLVEKVGSA